jgi:hypothetical protein
MNYSPDSEFSKLYSLFTPDRGSIGEHLNSVRARQCADDPLLVASGTDIVIFPGSGRPPLTQSFRLSTRGFIELTSVSHLGVAVPYIVRLRELGDAQWEAFAHRLIDQVQAVRAVNAESYWRDRLAVKAWAGLEQQIADMVDYSCDVTVRFLQRGLDDPTRLTFEHLREQYLDPVSSMEVPVPINDMMLATFCLVFLDTGHRVIGWLQQQSLDWQHMMVILSGRAGRTTAGLTWPTNNMCHLLWKASGERLPPERLYIAPHAPSLVLDDLNSEQTCAALEAQYRQIWFAARVTAEIGRDMFKGYPAFRPVIKSPPVVESDTECMGELPSVRSPQDRRGLITRLRFVMEDPAQQLSNAVAHYMIDQLCAADNQPSKVVIPGFTATHYPRRCFHRPFNSASQS